MFSEITFVRLGNRDEYVKSGQPSFSFYLKAAKFMQHSFALSWVVTAVSLAGFFSDYNDLFFFTSHAEVTRQTVLQERKP